MPSSRTTMNWSKRAPLAVLQFLILTLTPFLHAAVVTGEIVDSLTKSAIPARLYIQDSNKRWFFAESASPAGSAIRYEKRNWVNTNSVEMHVTLSAHPFQINL